MNVTIEELNKLISTKLMKAGLTEEHANVVADVLVHADARGYHSHGAMRVEYYAERIAKGGLNADPVISFEKTGPSTAIYDGDNGVGHFMAKEAMTEAINIAKESGIAAVGVRNIGHSGALSYFVQQAADEGMIGISVCQSDPMVVPFGGTEPFYGTNPIAFAAPSSTDEKIIFEAGQLMRMAKQQLIHLKLKHYFQQLARKATA